MAVFTESFSAMKKKEVGHSPFFVGISAAT